VEDLTKSDVGLSNVDNTADTAKPVSTLVQAALDLKAPLANPTFSGTVGGITKAMVGLSAVDNTADTAKPVSTLVQAALDLKAPLANPTFSGTVTAPALNLSTISSSSTSNVLYYNTTSKAVTYGAAPSGGSSSYTGGTSSSNAAGGANKVTGPGTVHNVNAAQLFFFYNSAGTQIGSGFQVNQNDAFFVPPGIKVAANGSAFTWFAWS
jgi:hypothetical protein